MKLFSILCAVSLLFLSFLLYLKYKKSAAKGWGWNKHTLANNTAVEQYIKVLYLLVLLLLSFDNRFFTFSLTWCYITRCCCCLLLTHFDIVVMWVCVSHRCCELCRWTIRYTHADIHNLSVVWWNFHKHKRNEIQINTHAVVRMCYSSCFHQIERETKRERVRVR